MTPACVRPTPAMSALPKIATLSTTKPSPILSMASIHSIHPLGNAPDGPDTNNRPLAEQGDLELVAIVRDSEDRQERESAYRVLVDRYKQRVHALCYRMLRDGDDADDAAQEAFVKAYKKIDTFRGDSQFYTWLYRVAANVSNDYYEARKRRRMRETADVNTVEPVRHGSADRPDRAVELEELKFIARRALEKVPPLFRTVLVLREYENLEYREIAQTLGVSVGTVMSRLFRARMRFKNAMEKLVPSLKKTNNNDSE